MTPQPKTCGECREKRTGDAPPYNEIILCPRHASAEALYEAAKKAETYFNERANPAPDMLLRRRYREEAEAATRAAVEAYEGK